MSENIVRAAEAIHRMGEYLRNVGFDIPKPDRHVRRMLGKDHLACSERTSAPIYDTFDIIGDIAQILGKSPAETDYILWSYCASGYGQMCIAQKYRCDECVVRGYCVKGQENK